MPGYRKGEESFFLFFYGNMGYRKKLPSGRIVALLRKAGPRGVQKAAVTGILNQAAESGRFHILKFGATTNFFYFFFLSGVGFRIQGLYWE